MRAFGLTLLAGGVALLTASWWLVRNVAVYGPADPLGLVRHDAVVVGQPRWDTFVPPTDLHALDFFVRILFRSFWGVFGWMGVILDDGFYVLYFVLTLLAVLGLLLPWLRTARFGDHGSAVDGSVILREHQRPKDLPDQTGGDGRSFAALRMTTPRRQGGEAPTSSTALTPAFALSLPAPWLIWAPILLVFAEVVYYNLTFVQPQGRYLFPALVPLAVVLALGWCRLADTARSRHRLAAVPAGLLAAALGWSFAEVHGAVRATELWSDEALVRTALITGTLALALPRPWRARLPLVLVGLTGLALALLDYAALVRFVAPAFPSR